MTHKRRLLCMALATVLLAGALTACGDDGQTTAPTTATPTTAVPTTATPVYYVTATKLNVRSGPGSDHEVLGTLPYGTQVEIVAVEGDWLCIRYGQGEAYVSAAYVATKTTQGVTTTTTGPITGTTSPAYTDRYIDGEGMLQFVPGDHYVQSDSYASTADIPWNLLLVNDWNPMQKGYDEAVTMQTVETKYAQINGNQRVDARMYADLVAMLEAGRTYNIGVQSSYRPYTHQERLYWNQVEKWKNTYSDPVELQSKAGEVVKRPGFSEHNSGLAVDLYGSGDTSLSPSFANTPAYAWLMENCADYGFILRFPQGKESITGVIYEAWHFRYVGSPAVAHAIMDNGLCLEEYLAQVRG